MTRAQLVPLGLLALAACRSGTAPSSPNAAPTPSASAAASADPMGPRPELRLPAPFTPPVPARYELPSGMTVWLLERHTLPLVAVNVVVPAGAAKDPAGQGGLAAVTANMLDEGAGKRTALQIASDVDQLGAVLQTGAYADYAFASLTTLKKNLGPASQILGDVVARPTFSAVEWKRVHDLWQNDLRARQSEPNAVAGVVSARQAFGAEHPYGHPTTGTLKSAAKVSLADVKRFYGDHYRPSAMTVVVVGDITRAELDPMLETAFAGFQEPRPSAAPPRPPPSFTLPAMTGRRVVVVDRKDAPQSVISVVRFGVAAGDPDAPGLVRVNGALGGSFTSRLNQDLREEHGWSYGAHSRFSFSRERGLFTADAAVHTEHTGEALKAMLADVEALANGGLTEEEIAKTKLLARADLVEAYEGVANAARRLARSAGAGLPPDHDAQASARLYAATPADLLRLAKEHVDVTNALVVIVGPRAQIEPQLKAIGVTTIDARSPEGE